MRERNETHGWRGRKKDSGKEGTEEDRLFARVPSQDPGNNKRELLKWVLLESEQ